MANQQQAFGIVGHSGRAEKEIDAEAAISTSDESVFIHDQAEVDIDFSTKVPLTRTSTLINEYFPFASNSTTRASSPQISTLATLQSTPAADLPDDNRSHYGSTPTSAIPSLISTTGTADVKTAETSPIEANATFCSGSNSTNMLKDTLFPDWQHDASQHPDLDDPEEMQRKDPLATQVWKFFHKAKSQLPNSERMENLTWRMMSMNLRRKELELQRFVVTVMTVSAELAPGLSFSF